MANIMPPEKRSALHKRILHSAAVLFLQNGYTSTTLAMISEHCGAHISKIVREFGCKENIMLTLADYVIVKRCEESRNLMPEDMNDPVFRYALDTSLKVHLAESSEALKDMYVMAYTLNDSNRAIRKALTEQLIRPAFIEYFPDAKETDFAMLSLAYTGILMNYMKLSPSDEFTPEEKQRSYLEACLRIYRVPDKKIEEAIAFVEKYDMDAVAAVAVDRFVNDLMNDDSFILESRMNKSVSLKKEFLL